MTPILVMEPTQYLDVKKVIVVTGYRFRDGQGQSLPIGKEEGIGGPALFAALVFHGLASPDGRCVATVKIDAGEVEHVPVPF